MASPPELSCGPAGAGATGLPGLGVGAGSAPFLAVAGPPHTTPLALELGSRSMPLGASTWSLPSAESTNKACRLARHPQRAGLGACVQCPTAPLATACVHPAAALSGAPALGPPGPPCGSGRNYLHRGQAALVELLQTQGKLPGPLLRVRALCPGHPLGGAAPETAPRPFRAGGTLSSVRGILIKRVNSQM